MEKKPNIKKSELTLSVNEDLNFEFFSEFDKLGNKEKEVWRLLVWWTKRFPTAYPSQTTIARKAECTREHVNRSISKFKKLGWIALGSRGPKKTKYIIIPLHLLQMDLVKREYFRRVDITSKITHSYSRKPRITGTNGPVAPKPLDVPNWLEKLGISFDSKLKLSLLPESVFQETLYQCTKKAKQGFKPDNEERYFVGTAFRIAEKGGVKVDWKSYYASRGN